MKTNPLLLGLFVAVAALGIWAAKISASLSEANHEIAALNKKLAAAQHDAAVALTQSQHTVENISTQSGSASAAVMGKNHIAANPQAAIAAALAMPPGPDRDAALMDALVAYAAIDPQAAWDAARNLPDNAGAGRTQLLKDIIKAWAAKDPAQAAAKYASLSLTETSANARWCVRLDFIFRPNWAWFRLPFRLRTRFQANKLPSNCQA